MSADNGIYILKNIVSDLKQEGYTHQYEYRVAYACAIENCLNCEDNWIYIHQVFGNKPPLRSEKRVSRVANKLKNDLLAEGYHIEYGIIPINNFQHLTFDQLIGRSATKIH